MTSVISLPRIMTTTISTTTALKPLSRLLGYKYVPRSFKQLGVQVEGLRWQNFLEEVCSHSSDFFVTPKVDGLHAFLVIWRQSFLLVHGNGEIASGATAAKFDDPNLLLLEGELFEDEKGVSRLYVFDVLFWRGTPLHNRNLAARLSLLQDPQVISWIQGQKGLTDLVAMKPFIQLEQPDFSRQLAEFYKLAAAGPVRIDGLIFCENKRYHDMSIFKWKPPELLTIDFFIHEGRLCCGANTTLIRALGLQAVATQQGASDYLPVLFKPLIVSAEAMVSEAMIREFKKHEGSVVECSWDSSASRWIIHKERKDRVADIQSGRYFGNDHRVAEFTFMMSLNPLRLADITTPAEELAKRIYFRTSNAGDDDVVRRYNNAIKRALINKYAAQANIVDLAFGKGQDLLKYMSAEVRTLIMAEWDLAAMEECVHRIYSQSKSLAGMRRPINLQLVHADLTEPATKLEALIGERMAGIDPARPLSVICNFALHYFSIPNIAALCKALTSPQARAGAGARSRAGGRTRRVGGRSRRAGSEPGTEQEASSHFICTILDRDRVLSAKNPRIQVLGSGSGGQVRQGRQGRQGQQGSSPIRIRIKLPFSIDFHEETLIDPEELVATFKKNGFTLTETAGFTQTTLLNHTDAMGSTDASQTRFNLSAEDKAFAGLYSYYVFTRETSHPPHY